MGALAVRVDGVAKRFAIGPRPPYRTLRESVVQVLGALGRGRSDRREADANLLWALDDVSFQVNRGEVVGIIGRNGAGKSTLLKILARITAPTRGTIDLYGRVGALLEVGTGFHPELTGRENIFLSGAVLGLRRSEIRRRFDAIVAFSEVERFLDTQVKHYSTGMFMRLAFSVAAHLEPEILVVDEVLAVGDASFQRKCLDRMREVGREGRTVLFVSHNMPAVTRLCPRTILLDKGRLLMDGPSHEVVTEYLRSGVGTTAERVWEPASAPGNDIVRLRAVRVRTAVGQVTPVADIRQPIGVELEFVVLEGGHRLVPNLHVLNEEGTCVFISSEVHSPWHRRPRPPGRYVTTAWIPGDLLTEGTLIVSAAISTMDPVIVHVYERDVVAFQVVDSMDGTSSRGEYAGHIPGVVRPLLRWETTVAPTAMPASLELAESEPAR